MKNSTLALIGGYALVLVLGFIGAPKVSVLTATVAFALFTAFYWGGVWFVKKFIVAK